MVKLYFYLKGLCDFLQRVNEYFSNYMDSKCLIFIIIIYGESQPFDHGLISLITSI